MYVKDKLSVIGWVFLRKQIYKETCSFLCMGGGGKFTFPAKIGHVG